MKARDLDVGGALVVAVDDSACGRAALRFAVDLARRLQEPLHVVSVWNFVTGTRPPRTSDTTTDPTATEQEWQAAAQSRVEALVADEVPDPAGADLRVVAVHGNVVPALLEISSSAGHLVVGSRGRGGFSGLLLGSTSDQLVHHATCPLTVVRGTGK
jgi:nucleotide-binding universal stress UspA family protein